MRGSSSKAAPATLDYSGTTFLHGLGSKDSIWLVPYATLGVLVGRGAFMQSGVGSARVAGIVAIAAPHEGAPLADSAKFAATYIENLEAAIHRAQNGARGVGDVLSALGIVLSEPVLVYIGEKYVSGASQTVDFPTELITHITEQRAVVDLRPDSATVTTLENYTGDLAVPRVTLRGSIPYGHAILRLAAASGATSFEDLKKETDQGLSALRQCRNVGNFTFNLTDPGNNCQLAASMLAGLDAKWAGWVNGSEYGRVVLDIYGQVPRRIPFDGVVPNERSNYPGGGLVLDLTVDGASHQDIYRKTEALDPAASAMITMGMPRANAVNVSIGGPSDFTGPGYLTWQASAIGGDGTYAYEWQYRPNDLTEWLPLNSNGSSATLYVDELTEDFTVRAIARSQGQAVWTDYPVANAVGGGGGSCPPPQVVCE